MQYITVKRPISTRLMKEVISYANKREFDESNTWLDLHIAFKLAMKQLNQGA